MKDPYRFLNFLLERKARLLYKIALLTVLEICVFNDSKAIVTDSLNTKINSETTTDSIKITLLNKLADKKLFNQPKEALKLNNQAISLSQKLGLGKLNNRSLFKRAVLFSRVSQIDSAMWFAELSAQQSNVSNDLETLGKSKNLLGSIYLSQGDNYNALQFFLDALYLFEQINHKEGEAASLNFIAFYYLKTENYKKALQYFKETESIFKKLKRSDQLGRLYNNKGVAYFQLKEYDSALTDYKKSLRMVSKQGFNNLAPVRELNIGKVYIAQNQFKQAENYLKKAFENANKFNNTRIITAAFIQLGILNKNLQKPHIAKHYLIKGLNSARNSGFKDLEIQSLELLSSIYQSIERYDSAFYIEKHFATLKDSLSKVESENKLLFLQGKFEADQKEKEIRILQQEAEIKDKLIFNVIAGSLLLTAIFVSVYFNYRSKQKRKNLIYRHEEEIRRKQITELLKEQELNTIKDSLKGQELERTRIAKELHDGIGGTLASIKLNLIQAVKKPEFFSPEYLTTIINRMHNACEEVRHISHNLTPPSFSRTNFTKTVQQFLSKTDMSSDISFSYELFDKKQLNNLGLDLKVDVYRMLQELINNTLKHSKASEVFVSLVAHEDYINLMVEDNGIGIKKEQTAEGIGLKNIKSRLDLLKGKVTIDSQPNKGSIINIDIPVQIKADNSLTEFR